MALYLPIRALNRSQNVRIDSQKISATTTAYIDISKVSVRREFAQHSAVGAVFPVGPLTSSNANQVVVGATVDEGSNAADMVVQVNPGYIRDRSTSAVVIQIKASTLTITAADATNPRIDVIQVNTTTGVVTKVDGTAAASPSAPAVTAGNVAIAQVTVPANDTAITTDQIADVAPR